MQNCDEDDNKELRRLQFYGAGPKMSVYVSKMKLKEELCAGKKGKANHCELDPVSIIDLM